jgi:hypothetical protein
MTRSEYRRVFETVLTIGAPLSLAVVESFHPHPHDLLDVDVQRWLAVHYLKILLFPLTALAVSVLVRGYGGIAAAVCRLGMFVFGVSYVAFDTAAGVTTDILVKAAHASGAPESWRIPIDAIWKHPIMGGSPLVAAPLLAVQGSVALSAPSERPSRSSAVAARGPRQVLKVGRPEKIGSRLQHEDRLERRGVGRNAGRIGPGRCRRVACRHAPRRPAAGEDRSGHGHPEGEQDEESSIHGILRMGRAWSRPEAF